MGSDLKQALDSLRIDREAVEPPSRRGRWIAAMAAGAVVVVGVGLWLSRARPVPVRTTVAEEATATSGGAPAVLNASGYVTARRQATVSSKVTGKVEEVFVEEGMAVEAGQVLARLDSSQARLALGLAQARRAATEKSLVETEARLREAGLRERRSRDLAAEGVAAQADLDAVEAEVDALEARLAAQREELTAADRAVALERQNLEDLVIRAPFAGVAISKNAQPGEMISPISAGGGFTRTGISTIVDMASLEVEVDVNEAYIQRVSPGQRVVATLDAYPDAPFPAKVITTIPAADRQKATVTVRIGFDQLDPRILPDMGVKVSFLAAPEADGTESSRQVLRVPRAALRGERGEEYVLVVDATWTLERRAVRLGPGGGDPAEVLAGLSAGERVVIEGPAELVAGQRVIERR
jgi:RND family efflux transporter MFP subunit